MKNRFLLPQILLTISAFEFFGPAIRDSGTSHLLNAEWVGHARVHLVWALGFMVTSGLVNLYLIWRRHENKLRDLYLSCVWQGCNIIGFWISVLFVDHYHGAIIDPKQHMLILGIDENIVAFAFLTVVLVSALLVLKFRVETEIGKTGI
ncbi:hypothetical protein [Alterisphingorhabdus coralli]|uniref:DUF2231 domain-containing protein n=1 Tax=Alterisphingorhabdus coralli TaxID=3071408 RepID=A0AA97I1B7_9SPHN|nr:hypothetical protein [Parasphingorhabdus sp. SCSIO 66989]WOE76579.1 hypothetical protein RB602_07665 [Parasphingorhabdus sp. SCSIO 66989]